MQLIHHRKRTKSLLSKVKRYRARGAEISAYLDQRPGEWGMYQSEFNQEVDAIFREISEYSQELARCGKAQNVERLKLLFVEKIRPHFLNGQFIRHSYSKPRGYAGDYQIIDAIYKNRPRTNGYERLFDNYYQMSPICTAVRNRKEDFKRYIYNLIRSRPSREVKILNLASGPCREIYELLQLTEISKSKVKFHCIDQDKEAVRYAKALINDPGRVSFTSQNVSKIALKSNIENTLKDRYDLVYSTGLFDYLEYRFSVRLIKNLKKLLKSDGVLMLSDVREPETNSSMSFMEWVTDWNLIYRSDSLFRDIFVDAGFEQALQCTAYEQQGVFQYVLASSDADILSKLIVSELEINYPLASKLPVKESIFRKVKAFMT